jgi:hypothetical protein
MKNNNPCYGNMFPDLLRFQLNVPNEGHVFSAFAGSVGMGVQERRLTVKKDQWQQCVVCPDYRSCYDLSHAKTTVQRALLDL